VIPKPRTVSVGSDRVVGLYEYGVADDRQMLDMAVKRAWLARLIMGGTARMAKVSPKSALKSFRKEVGSADAAVLDAMGPPDEAMALFTQAFLKGARGVVDDYAAIAEPWGVDLDAITGPVRIYQGDADTMVPPRHSEELAERLKGADLVVWPDEGHLATVTHVGEILDWLAEE
jgi:pimeloyl-ACP methyl ester carboxylesterase